MRMHANGGGRLPPQKLHASNVGLRILAPWIAKIPPIDERQWVPKDCISANYSTNFDFTIAFVRYSGAMARDNRRIIASLLRAAADAARLVGDLDSARDN